LPGESPLGVDEMNSIGMKKWLKQAAKAFKNAQPQKLERGMTLVEIMVVVVIISLVAGVVGVSVFGRLKEAQIRTAKTQIKTISDALDLYKLQFHSYPSTAEGLGSLTAPKGSQEPFLKQVPKDPWGKNYVYIFPGTHNSGGFDIMSYGPDTGPGGSDDIGNWEKPTSN